MYWRRSDWHRFVWDTARNRRSTDNDSIPRRRASLHQSVAQVRRYEKRRTYRTGSLFLVRRHRLNQDIKIRRAGLSDAFATLLNGSLPAKEKLAVLDPVIDDLVTTRKKPTSRQPSYRTSDLGIYIAYTCDTIGQGEHLSLPPVQT